MPTGCYERTLKWKEKFKDVMSLRHKGKHKTAEWKEKIRQANLRGKEIPCCKCGKLVYRHKYRLLTTKKFYCSIDCRREDIGIHFKTLQRNDEWYQKVSDSLKKRYREEGILAGEYVSFTSQIKERARVRDNFICQMCGIPELECDTKLDCHHIDYNKKNSSLDNLLCLCKSCHTKTNFNRKYWIIHFQERRIAHV
jgi:hypothetical protein